MRLCKTLAERHQIGGRAFWVNGASGTGKTTIARLLARTIASDEWGAIIELDAGELSPERVRDIADTLHTRSMGIGGRAVIVNEAHGIRAASMRALLVALEPIPKHSAWIFTTTNEGEHALFEGALDAGPLVSRCVPIALSRRDLSAPFAERAHEIGTALGLKRDRAWYTRLMKEVRNNFRMALSQIEAESLTAEIEEPTQQEIAV